MSGDFNPNGTGIPARGPSADGQEGRRLPPPAFPPGAKRPARHRLEASSDDLSAALIHPDDPIPDRAGNVPDEAFLSPDEPIRRRAPRTATPMASAVDLDEVVVTGIGDDAHLGADELALGFDPHVLEVVETVGKLAEALKRKGEAGLKATPEMTRLETTLRSYIVGYLAGRRAADEEG